MKLTLIRGLPGSGKSTLATKMVKELSCLHYEADMFFCNSGVYMFDPSKIGAAHAWCQEQTLAGLNAWKDVIVSNTFTQIWEITPYLEIAERTGADVYVMKMATQYGSIHGVPPHAMSAMAARWEDIQGEITVC